MPDAALGFINHSGALFFAFSLSRSACGRVRRYPTSTSGPAQILPRLNACWTSTRSIKNVAWKKVGEGSSFWFWRFCPPHRLPLFVTVRA